MVSHETPKLGCAYFLGNPQISRPKINLEKFKLDSQIGDFVFLEKNILK
jgi:hypothetical protein